MTRTLKICVGTVLAAAIVGGCAASYDKPMADKKMTMAGTQSRAHIGHVMTGWKDTPGGKGLLVTAQAEAKIAQQHANFALAKPDNIKWMKTHTTHVLHAVDPSAMAKGPGLGYGVVKAAGGAAKHIQFAAKSLGASKNVKLHATHVAASANNAVDRAKKIVASAKLIAENDSEFSVAAFVREMKNLTDEIIAGDDANGDGKVSWKKGEGGLAQADKYMGFMMKAEKM
jgi:hypothetical protein